MIKIDSLEKAFAYSVGMLDLETGEIGGDRVADQLSKMHEYCKLYGEVGVRKEEVCPNYINCRYHPVPNYCIMKINENLSSTINEVLDKNN